MKTQKRILLLPDSAPGLMIRINGNNDQCCNIDVITRFSDTNIEFGEICAVGCDIISIHRGCDNYNVDILWASGTEHEYTHDHDQIVRGAELATQYDYWQDGAWTYMTPKTAQIMYKLLGDRSVIIQRYWLLCDMFYGDIATIVITGILDLLRCDVSWYETIE